MLPQSEPDLKETPVPEEIGKHINGLPEEGATTNREPSTGGVVIDLNADYILRDDPVCSVKIAALTIVMCLGIAFILGMVVPVAKYFNDKFQRQPPTLFPDI